MNLAPYRKSIVAVIGTVITWGSTAQDEGIHGSEWWGLAFAVATALGVYQVANTPVRRRRGERGAIEPGSLALGLVAGLILGFLIWAGAAR